MDAQLIRELFDYDADSGLLRWRDRARSRKVDGVVGTRCKSGYLTTRLIVGGGPKSYYIHRLIWLWVYGEWPPMDIDHANLDRTDNRLSNLRLASESDNVHNQRCRNDNGFKGVWRQKSGNWAAGITKDRKRIHLGTFPTPEQANDAYRVAAESMHGDFARG
jgi:HNH endonuclease/AP2 domain